jgi:nicotinate-nucleotide pyrophosphorylase
MLPTCSARLMVELYSPANHNLAVLGILAGVPFFTKIFEHLGCTVEWKLAEGAGPS